MAIKLNATARLRTTAATTEFEPWAKQMFNVVKTVDNKADIHSMASEDGYWTTVAKGFDIEEALHAAGYRGKKLTKPSSYKGTSFEARGVKGKGLTVTFPDDEGGDVAVLHFY